MIVFMLTAIRCHFKKHSTKLVTFSKKTFCCLVKKIHAALHVCVSFQMLKASLDAYMASLCETDEVYTPRFHSSKRKKCPNFKHLPVRIVVLISVALVFVN